MRCDVAGPSEGSGLVETRHIKIVSCIMHAWICVRYSQTRGPDPEAHCQDTMEDLLRI